MRWLSILLVLNSFLFSQDINYDGKVDSADRDSVQKYLGDSLIYTPTCIDYDGNSYKVVLIGNLWWMVENLKTTHYSDGTAIANVTSGGSWAGLTTGAYAWYNNDQSSYEDAYGVIYNWFAVDSLLAPSGWRVASDADWDSLEAYFGMTEAQSDSVNEFRGAPVGTYLKGDRDVTGGDGHPRWNSNGGGIDSLGFAAYPGGYRRGTDGSFRQIGEYAYFWTSTENGSEDAYNRMLRYNYNTIGRYDYFDKDYGYSVRCVRDVEYSNSSADVTGDTLIDGRDYFALAKLWLDSLVVTNPNDDSLKINFYEFYTSNRDSDSLYIQVDSTGFQEKGSGDIFVLQDTLGNKDTTLHWAADTAFVSAFHYLNLYTFTGWIKGIHNSLIIAGASTPDPTDQYSGSIIVSASTKAMGSILNDNSGNLSITGNIATFSNYTSSNFPDSIGVGDLIEWDDSGYKYAVIKGLSVDANGAKAYVTTKDGSTAPTSASGQNFDIYRQYNSIYDWENNNGNSNITVSHELTDTDLTDADDEDGPLQVAVFFDDSTTGQFTISGWTTDTDDTIRIFTPTTASEVGTSQRHTGTANSSFRVTASTGHTITINDRYITLEGLIISSTSSGASDEGIRVDPDNSSSMININSCIIYHEGTPPNQADGVYISNNGNLTLTNNLIYNWNRACVHVQHYTGLEYITIYAYNNTLYRNDHTLTGILEARENGGEVEVYAYNNWAGGQQNDVNSGAGPFSNYGPAGPEWFTGWNVSDTTWMDIPDAATDTTLVDEFESFVSPGTGPTADFKLKAGSPLINYGVGPADSSFIPSVDILGNPRSGSSTSVGAFEYISP